MATILAGDIGGTNTRLALYAQEDMETPQALRTYPSGDYESLWAIVSQYLEEVGQAGHKAPSRAGFGIAGPVDGTIVKLTNLPWVIDRDQLAERLRIPSVRFVNDFSANCLAVPRLSAQHLHQIGGTEPEARGPIAVIGAGTGLGEGFVVWQGERPVVIPSEGGHTDFAPRNPLEARLLTHLTGRFGRTSYERVVSGQGLQNIYEFFRDVEGLPESEEVRARIAKQEPLPKIVTDLGMARADTLCERTLDLFCSVYGAEAGNLALQVLATGGVFLAGGIAKYIIPRLEEGGFRHGFESKGRFAGFLQEIPVYLILHDQPGLLGAAHAALED